MDTTKNSNDYPSCIKIPALKSKLGTLKNNTMSLIEHNKHLVNANNALISLANEIFGERKWSHSVTSQTLDFIDCQMGNYSVGCSTFVKILLHDGNFHEDVGYSSREGAVKGETIHCAKLSSYNDALTKVLSSFGGRLKVEVERLSKELLNTLPKESDKYEISSRSKETKELCSCIDRSRSKEYQTPKSNDIVDSNSTVQKNQNKELPSKSDNPSNQKMECTKKSSTEELLRMERKRKQMEKQMEYKKLMKEREMKEKELLKTNGDNKESI